MVNIVLSVILSYFLVISLFDVKYMRIPLFLSIPLLSLSLIFSYIRGTTILDVLIFASVGFIFFYIVRIFTKNGLGLGDALLSASIASVLGSWLWLLSMTTASLLALIYILSVKYVSKVDIKKKRIPFAPFMSAGAAVFLLYQYFIN